MSQVNGGVVGTRIAVAVQDPVDPSIQRYPGLPNGLALLDGSGLIPSSEIPPVSPSGPAGGDLSGTYPNPSVVDDSHLHTPATVSGFLRSTTVWTLYRDTDFTAVSGASPWVLSDGVGSSTWTTGGGAVSASSGILLSPTASTSTFSGASITGAWVRSPISYLPTSYQDGWVCVAVKIGHSVVPPGTAGQYMSPALMLMTTTAATGARLAGVEFGGDGAALKVQARIYDSGNIQGGSLAPSSTPTWVAILIAPHGQSYRVGYGSPSGSPSTWTPASLTWSQPYYQVSINTLGPDLATIAISAIRGTTAYTATVQEIAIWTGSGGA